MSPYIVHTPWWLASLYPRCTWHMPVEDKSVYLTFDDGPHPVITPFVLNELEKVGAKATFFCIGNNVNQHNDVFEKIKDAGHSIGNHTYNHLNGWKTSCVEYKKDVLQAQELIQSPLFRPPYGRITYKQVNALLEKDSPIKKIIMWSILSGDFDTRIGPKTCANNIIKHIRPGSIIVMHDSEKAFPRMKESLPIVLDYCQKKNYKLKAIS